MNKSIEFNPKDIEIAELSALGKMPNEIAEELNIGPPQVFGVLEKPEIAKYIDHYVQRKDIGLQVQRIKAAHTILPKVTKLVHDILDQYEDSKKKSMKMGDFKVIEMMLRELNKAEVKAINFVQQININPITEEKEDVDRSDLDKTLAKLPTRLMIKFWDDVDKLAEKYLTQFNNEQYRDGQQVSEVQVVSGDQVKPGPLGAGGNVFRKPTDGS